MQLSYAIAGVCQKFSICVYSILGAMVLCFIVKNSLFRFVFQDRLHGGESNFLHSRLSQSKSKTKNTKHQKQFQFYVVCYKKLYTKCKCFNKIGNNFREKYEDGDKIHSYSDKFTEIETKSLQTGLLTTTHTGSARVTQRNTNVIPTVWKQLLMHNTDSRLN